MVNNDTINDALNAVHRLEIELVEDLRGKSFAAGDASPIEALDQIREAITLLRIAKIKLGIK